MPIRRADCDDTYACMLIPCSMQIAVQLKGLTKGEGADLTRSLSAGWFYIRAPIVHIEHNQLKNAGPGTSPFQMLPQCLLCLLRSASGGFAIVSSCQRLLRRYVRLALRLVAPVAALGAKSSMLVASVTSCITTPAAAPATSAIFASSLAFFSCSSNILIFMLHVRQQRC